MPFHYYYLFSTTSSWLLKRTPGSRDTTYARKDKVHLHDDPAKTQTINTQRQQSLYGDVKIMSLF